jgi:PilZ domain
VGRKARAQPPVTELNVGDVVVFGLPDGIAQKAVVTLTRPDRVVLDWLGAAPVRLPQPSEDLEGIVQTERGFPFAFTGRVVRTSSLARAALTITEVVIAGRANRRRDRRVPSAIGVKWTPTHSTRPIGEGRAVDLSESGVRFRVLKGVAPHVGDFYHVELHLRTGPATVAARALPPIEDHHRFHFTALTEDALTRIRRVVVDRS